jgi:prepilin-type N-terminal cleavage/methylation domain-containing protein
MLEVHRHSPRRALLPPVDRRRQAGLTLVELMIGLVVAAVVAQGVFMFFAGQSRIYSSQVKLLNVQQNLWTAMELIGRHVRSAGAGTAVGCPKVRTFYNGVGYSDVVPTMVTDGVNGAPDQLTITYYANATSSWYDAMLENTIPRDWTASAMKVPTGETGFRNGDFILVLDTQPFPPGGDRGCTMFQISQVPSSDRLLVVNPSSPWNAPGPVPGLIPWDYTGVADGGAYAVRNLGTRVSVRFFIDATGAPTRPPRLMMDDLSDAGPAQTLAEGIEDLQLAYACDVSPTDGTITEGTTAATKLVDEWIFNQAGDVIPATCTKPMAIRVTLVARTKSEDDTLRLTGPTPPGGGIASGTFKPAAENGAAGAPDLYRHRLLTTSFVPRN